MKKLIGLLCFFSLILFYSETVFANPLLLLNDGTYDGNEICSNNLTVLNICTCPSSPQNWNVNMANNCVLNSVCNITGYNLTFYGDGNFTVNNTLYVNELKNISSGMTVWMKPEGIIYNE